MSTVRLNIIKADGTKYDITNAVTKISWQGDYKQSARKLAFSMVASDIDVKDRKSVV